jgi:hypothetical protein
MIKMRVSLTSHVRPVINSNRGFAIMLVLMMLFLLFMLGVAFFFSAWTHAFIARNYLNMRRAFVVAEGSLWHAVGNIIGDFSWVAHAQNKPIDYRWKYWDDIAFKLDGGISKDASRAKRFYSRS